MCCARRLEERRFGLAGASYPGDVDLNPDDAALLDGLRRLVQRLNELPDTREASLTELGERV